MYKTVLQRVELQGVSHSQFSPKFNTNCILHYDFIFQLKSVEIERKCMRSWVFLRSRVTNISIKAELRSFAKWWCLIFLSSSLTSVHVCKELSKPGLKKHKYLQIINFLALWLSSRIQVGKEDCNFWRIIAALLRYHWPWLLNHHLQQPQGHIWQHSSRSCFEIR